jgi:outer membrane protein OmpA-like peptidoglycan-associated protein/tetratricopeptide (TPR) repeat protein
MINRIVLFFLVMVFSAAFAVAQITTSETAKGRAKELYDKGNNHYAFGRLYLADSLLHLAVQDKDNFIDAWLLIGNINLDYLKNNDEAINAFQKVKLLKADYFPDVDFLLAKGYMNKGEYDNCKTLIEAYLKKEKLNAVNRMWAEKMLKDCDFAKEAMKNPVNIKPINMGNGINTEADESMPSLTADDKYLYFTRHFGTGIGEDEDIYVSVNTGAGFGEAKSVGTTINTEMFIEGAQSVSPSGKYLFFTSADRQDGVGRADIYISRKTGDNWERPNNLGNVINSPGWDGQPCISADGRTLFFSSVKATGRGGSDIYMSTLGADGRWGTPQNLGVNINTQYDEMRPFIHPDGKTLYFSSTGHPGMGNFDFFVSTLQDDGSWGAPKNLGYPINTPGDDLGIFVSTNGQNAYFASEQKDSKGQMDIYTFEMPDVVRPNVVTYVKGIVYDKETKKPLKTNIQIYDLSTGKVFSTLTSDAVNGEFLTTLPAGKNYACQILQDGYLFYSENFSLEEVKDSKPYKLNIQLSPLKVGQVVVLNNIFYDPNLFSLKEESKTEMNTILDLLKKNPTLKIEIGGHTDNTGSDYKNQILSENRAKAVFEYLMENEIAESRVTYKGYSSTKPVSTNDTEEGKAKNRRTEITITGI